MFEVYVVDARGHLVTHSDARRLHGNLDVSDVEIVRQFREYGGRTGLDLDDCPGRIGARGPELFLHHVDERTMAEHVRDIHEIAATTTTSGRGMRLRASFAFFVRSCVSMSGSR
jgi:hypothetical protein